MSITCLIYLFDNYSSRDPAELNCQISLISGQLSHIIDLQEKGTGKKKGKWVPILIGISRDKIFRFDPETKEVLKEYRLPQLKRWVSSINTFTFDFGDFESEYYVIQTNEGEAISQMIAGYIDIILKIRRGT